MFNKDNIKKLICNKWENGNCEYIKEKCWFAHGEDDLIKKECFYGIKYYNKNRCFTHTGGCIAYDNKKNNKYKHNEDIMDSDIDSSKNVKNNEKLNVIKKIDFNDNDFPKLIKEENIDINIKENKIDNIGLPILINNKIKDEENDFIDINSIKKELFKEYKFLSKLNPEESWANDDIIEETNKKIKFLTDKYNILKEKKNDIINEELKLELLENNDNKKDLEETLTCININNDNYSNPNVNISFNYNDESNDNILSIIKEMEKNNKKYITRIKNILDKDETIIKEEYKIYYKIQINQFMKELYLLKINYNDLIKD